MCGAEYEVCWEVERVWEPPAEGARWLQSQRAPQPEVLLLGVSGAAAYLSTQHWLPNSEAALEVME